VTAIGVVTAVTIASAAFNFVAATYAEPMRIMNKYSNKPKLRTFNESAGAAVGLIAAGVIGVYDTPHSTDLDQKNSCKNVQIEYKADNVAEITPPRNCQFIIK
jgi:hypothetical protein